MNDLTPFDAASNRHPSTDRLASLLAALGDIPVVTDPTIVRRRSRDFFWYSPVLNDQLNDKSADLIVAPRNEADIVRVAAACVRHRVPLTVRAGGTGNYGQAVPLAGGVLLDITALEMPLAPTRICPGLIHSIVSRAVTSSSTPPASGTAWP